MTASEVDPWQLLERRLKHRRLAIFVGAGISVCSGIPLWSELVKGIADELGYDADAAMQRFHNESRVLSLLRQHFSIQKPSRCWAEVVRQILYRDHARQRKEHACGFVAAFGKESSAKLVQFFEATNPVLSAIVRLTAIPSGAGFVNESKENNVRCNPRVAAILTYNFDALLQEYDRARHGSSRLLRTIERASKESRAGKICLYHLHGYMKPYSDGMADDAPDRLVLTEQEYNDYTDDPLGFGTSAALQALRENVCVFVGCSMKDELMRRALRRWYRERIRSIAEEHPESEPYDVEKRWKRHFAVMERSTPKMEQAIHTDLHLSGVYPLWVDNFDVDLVQRLTHLGVFLERMSQCDVDERGKVRNGQI